DRVFGFGPAQSLDDRFLGQPVDLAGVVHPLLLDDVQRVELVHVPQQHAAAGAGRLDHDVDGGLEPGGTTSGTGQADGGKERAGAVAGARSLTLQAWTIPLSTPPRASAWSWSAPSTRATSARRPARSRRWACRGCRWWPRSATRMPTPAPWRPARTTCWPAPASTTPWPRRSRIAAWGWGAPRAAGASRCRSRARARPPRPCWPQPPPAPRSPW